MFRSVEAMFGRTRAGARDLRGIETSMGWTRPANVVSCAEPGRENGATMKQIYSATVLVATMILTLLVFPAVTGAGPAKGTITFKSKSGSVVVEIKHAFLVKGPDMVTGKPMRRVVLSVADVGPALDKCATMMCSDGGIGEGMTIDFDAGPRVNYWFVANDQRVQYSGTADPASVKLTTNTANRIAGTWDLDATAAGGPVMHLQFDAALTKELKK